MSTVTMGSSSPRCDHLSQGYVSCAVGQRGQSEGRVWAELTETIEKVRLAISRVFRDLSALDFSGAVDVCVLPSVHFLVCYIDY